jgi:Reverse transcriptase (RNA-dependent DNA polymerase)
LGFSLTDDVIKWIRSFLTGRTQQVAHNGTLSTTQSVFLGLPQGSVLAPILYVYFYCNSLLYGIADGLLQKLQSIQNAAALLVTGSRQSEHITPVLRELHWLPV